MRIPISASPNSTRPRSSRRLTIARARNSICLSAMPIGCPILKQHLRAERPCRVGIPANRLADGADGGDVNGRAEGSLPVATENMQHTLFRRREQCQRARRRLIEDAKRHSPDVVPCAHGANAIARPIPVWGRRSDRNRAARDRLAVPVVIGGALLDGSPARPRRHPPRPAHSSAAATLQPPPPPPAAPP